MSNKLEDISTCVREGRKPKDHGPYQIEVGNEQLEFTAIQVDDPVLTGLQISEGMGVWSAEDHLVFQVLSNGELEELRLGETTDLRSGDVERFLIFRSAESHRFEIDGKRLEWGAKIISGRVLKRLVGVDPAKFVVWQEIRGQDDRPIGNTDLVHLDSEGLEHFFTGVPTTTEGAV